MSKFYRPWRLIAKIAAIALHDLPLATRNGKDFKDIEGLTLLNPWE